VLLLVLLVLASEYCIEWLLLRRTDMPSQVIYESDPMDTRGKRGEIAQDTFIAGEALLQQHPEIECVVITTVTNDDPELPAQNAVCFRQSIKDNAQCDEKAHDAVVEGMKALLKLAKQIKAYGLFGPRSAQG
jgi:hypothetical protein